MCWLYFLIGVGFGWFASRLYRRWKKKRQAVSVDIEVGRPEPKE